MEVDTELDVYHEYGSQTFDDSISFKYFLSSYMWHSHDASNRVLELLDVFVDQARTWCFYDSEICSIAAEAVDGLLEWKDLSKFVERMKLAYPEQVFQYEDEEEDEKLSAKDVLPNLMYRALKAARKAQKKERREKKAMKLYNMMVRAAATATTIPQVNKVSVPESVNWAAIPTSPHKPLPDINTVDESPHILEEIPCNLSEISTDIVNPSNTESTDEILASGPRKWPALTTTLPEIAAVNKSPSISLEKPYQMWEKRSISSCSSSPVSPSRISKFWLTQNWRARPQKTVDESSSVMEENTCSLSESCIVDITNITNIELSAEPIASESVISTSLQKSSFETSIAHESPPVLEQMKCDLPEISTTVDITNIESLEKSFASESTSLQKQSFETSIAYESSPILEQILCDLSEISTAIVDDSDIESKKDEIIASGSSNWTAASARKEEVFESTVTIHAISKSSPASHIEKDIEAMEAPDKAYAESVDVKTQNEEVFEPTRIIDPVSKNPPALHVKDIEISAAVDMSSPKHLIEQDGSTTEAFDSDIRLRASSKNSSIQHIENSETLEKESIYIYELSVLSAFDLSIDIDFEVYMIESVTSAVTYLSTQSSVTSSTSSVTSSVVLQPCVEETSGYGREQSSTCSADYATSSYEREQSSTCFVEWTMSDENRKNEEYDDVAIAEVYHTTSVHEGEQISCFANTVTTSDTTTKSDDTTVTKSTITTSTVTKSVHHALFAYCLAWIQYITMPCMILWTLYEYITLFGLLTGYKARPKVKIKRLLEPEHVDSRSSTVAEIFAEITYKMVLFSGSMEGLKMFESEVFDPAYDFGISGLQNSHLIPCNCDESKALLLWIFGILQYLFYEFQLFHTHKVVCLA